MLGNKKQPTKFEVSLQQWFRDTAHGAKCGNTVCVVIPEGSVIGLVELFGKFYPAINHLVESGKIYIKNVVDISVEDLDNQISEVDNVQHLHDLKTFTMVEEV